MAEGLSNSHGANSEINGGTVFTPSPYPRHLLHLFPTFSWGGVQIRIANIINHFGGRYRHTILPLDGRRETEARIDRNIDVEFLPAPAKGRGFPFNLLRYRSALRRLQPDLLITYNWGAIEWALANNLSPICRHIHMESGFGPEEATRQLRRRVWFRRAALHRCETIIVPSQNLANIATRVWKLDPGKVIHIANGVDIAKFAVPPRIGVPPNFNKAPDELIIGTVAPLRTEKNIARLLYAFAQLANEFNSRLMIVGDGVERQSLAALAAKLNIAEKVVFAGHLERVEEVLGWLDVFAISSDTEQMPNTVVQAMAAGRPVVGTDVGDVKAILAPPNRAYIAPPGDDEMFCSLLRRLMADADLRANLGRCNQDHARRLYSQDRMFEAYESILDTWVEYPRQPRTSTSTQ